MASKRSVILAIRDLEKQASEATGEVQAQLLASAVALRQSLLSGAKCAKDAHRDAHHSKR